MNIFNLFKRNKYPLGLIGEDPEDSRDYNLLEIQPKTIKLPDTFSLTGKMTSIQKQNWGSCTSHMADGLKEFLDTQEYRREIKLSQKFIYYNTKKISGLWNTQGDFLRNALKSVCRYGACLETTFPDIKKNSWEEYVHEEPPIEAYKEAEEYKGKTYWSVGKTLENFRQTICQQKAPIGFGMMWYEGYKKITSDGKLPLPSGKKISGHAICAVDWTNEKLKIRNSWGSKWSDKGYFYIPFNEFDKHEIWNAWVLTDVKKPEKLIGYVAGKYLKRMSSDFQSGDIVTPIANLNLRERPTTNSNKLALLKPNQKLEILKDGIQGGNYKWYQVIIK